MPTTSPDNIYYADGTTPASIATITASMATSVQNALNVRETKSYSWADATAKAAQTGMANGEIGFQIDNATYYIYNGSGWATWAKQPTAYTPTFTNLTPTSTNFVYSISGGRVFVTGKVVNSTTTTAGIRFTLPTDYNVNTTYVDLDTTYFKSTLGTAMYFDASTSEEYPGIVSAYSTGTPGEVLLGRFVVGATNVNMANVGNNQPFGAAWASGDIINVNFSYPVA